MKNSIHLIALLSLSFFFSACLKDKCEREVTYLKATPVYYNLEEIRNSIELEASKTLKVPGKIYYYNNYLFINEQKEGVHIFDNNDPQNPVNLGFLKIPGNVDIAVRQGILYADSYIDLVAIDIRDISNPAVLHRVEATFPQYGITQEGLLIDYIYEEVTEMRDCDIDGIGIFNEQIDLATAESTGVLNSSGGNGTGGSLARFALYDNYLYTIDYSNLHVFDISQLNQPTEVNEVVVGWDIETIFSYTDKLFIGSTTGMIIMNAANPTAPEYLSSYDHFLGCDPVFVKEPYAYVTLRSGNQFCADNGNQLDLVNITDMSSIYLEKSFGMDNPHGLSIKDNTLFICEGDFGLKAFDIEKPLELDQHQLAHLKNIQSFDIISLPGTNGQILVIGTDGFYQYDVRDIENPVLLSHIPVEK